MKKPDNTYPSFFLASKQIFPKVEGATYPVLAAF